MQSAPLRLLGALAAAMLVCDVAEGVVIFSVSSPDDLQTLVVGQSATVNVDVSLDAQDELDFFAIDVGFDSALFGAPSSITPGSIIPDPGSTFFAGGFSNLVSAVFNSAGTNIVAGGTVFSFQLPVIGLGDGEIQASTIVATGPPDATNTPIVIEALTPAQIDAVTSVDTLPASVIPEPTSLIVWLALAGIALACSAWRRRITAI